MTGVEELPAAPEYGPLPQYPIESVDNALRVLVLLGQRRSLRLTDVSHYLGVASSTAHRLLAMLVYRGVVQQDPATKSYVPGAALDELAFGVLRRLDVRNRARPVLEQLNADLRETVHLGQLQHADVHFIDSIESSRALRVGSRLGRVMPAHCTSTGKALLSTLTDEQVVRLYPDEQLSQLTPQSIDTRSGLLAALVTVRRRGYATSREESEEGVSSLAIPVLRADHAAPLAINVSVPRSRMNRANEAQLMNRLRSAAEELARLTG